MSPLPLGFYFILFFADNDIFYVDLFFFSRDGIKAGRKQFAGPKNKHSHYFI